MTKFCAVPWQETYITADGHYGLCCMADQNHDAHQRVPVSSTVQQHRNSAYMREIRVAFREGHALPQCQHCWRDEEVGKVSGRQRRNQQYFGQSEIIWDDPVIQQIQDQTSEDGTFVGSGAGLFFSVGDLCQLRCIDCAPSYSRSILKDYKKLGWDANEKSRRIVLHDSVNVDQADLWQRVRELAPGLRWLKIQGGEPTLSRPLLEFLKWHAHHGHAQNTVIAVVTNAVNIKQEFIDALKPFQQVRLEISVDGVGAVDEYLRYPTNWNKKQQLIDQLLELFPGSVLHSVVYALSLGDLPNLIEWGSSKPALHSIQCLTWPDNLSIQHLPTEYKQHMAQALQSWATDSGSYQVSDHYDPVAYRNNGVNAVLKSLAEPGDPEKWEYIKKLIANYDAIRPHRYENIVPSMSAYL